MSTFRFRSRRLSALLGLLAALAWPHSARAQTPDADAGALSAAFNVSSIGAATYTVGLNLPPGTNGMEPELAVLYNNQAADGVLGLGFSLTGLSSITRCAATEAQDGYVGAVSFDRQDRFCLDGNRLILISSGEYGAEGTVYHTEQETWTRVVAEGACGSGPCSFTATNKDGWMLEFSTEDNARLNVPTQPEVIAWQINRIVDLNDNTVEVEYLADETTLQNNPSAIRYTGNLTTGLEPQRVVYFDYEDRPDDVQKYQGGIRFVGSQRLVAIRTEFYDPDQEGTWQPVATYRFEYQQSASSGRSLLTSIEACATASGQCLSPTTFSWQQTTSAVASPNNNADGRLIDGWCAGDDARLDSGDFNGDGRPDLLCVADGTPYVLLSTGSGVMSPNNTADGQLSAPDGWCEGTGAVISWADFNADQLIDLTCAGDSTFEVLVSDGADVSSPNSRADGALNVAAGWCPSDGQCRAGWVNFNGDGSADLACSCIGGEQQVLVSDGSDVSTPNASADGTVATGYCTNSGAGSFWSDFNGDGMADLFCRDGGAQSVLVSTGDALESPNDDAGGLLTTGWCGDSQSVLSTADFNGDGLQDLACHGTDGAQQIMLSTERSLASPNDQADGTVRTDWCAGDPQAVDWGDFNGDGLSDLFCHGADGTQSVLISTGSEVTSPVPDANGVIATGWCGSGTGTAEDFNGDALTDLRCFDPDAGSVSALLHDAPFPDLLNGIVNGLSGSYDVAYLPMTDDAVYSRDSAAEYPVLEVETPIYVVEQYTESDGRGGDYSFGYHYTGARTHLELRQWLGFRSVKRTTLADGRFSITEYTQDYPVIQFIERAETYSSSRAILTSAGFTPFVANPYDQVYQVLRASEVSSTYTNGQPDYVFEKDYQYDAYGNPSLIADLGDVGDEDDTFDCWKYANQATDNEWLIGYNREHKTTRTRQACSDFLATDATAWDPATDLRWETTDYDEEMNPTALSAYDDANAIWLTQGSTYDEYGNSITMTDWAGNTTRYTFDDDTSTFVVRVQSPETESGVTLELNFGYDPRFGVLTSETDPNGNQRRSELDDFGRIVEEWGPDPGSDSGQASMQLAEYTYGSDAEGTYAEVRDRPNWDDGDPADWPWSRVYVDGLARPVETTKSGPTGGQQVVTQQLYNDLRLPSQTSLPRFVGDTAAWVETLYDDLDRPTRVIQPDGTFQTIEYLQGELLVHSVMAADTTDARETMDQNSVRDMVLRSTASNQGSVQYQYDPMVRVSTVIGANGDVTTLTYDSLDRVTLSLNSDSGSKTIVYNNQGQLASVTDGEGNVTGFEYDAIGRITQKSIDDGNGSVKTYLFFYDEPQYTNPKGNLTRVVEPESSYEFSYTRYGLVATERLDFEGEGWVQQSEYGPSGEVTRLVYPDGAVRTASYDGQGNVQTLELQAAEGGEATTVARYTAYNALNEVLTVEYGNGVSTEYSYYSYPTAMGRLESVVASAPDAATLSRAVYGWNKVGQVASRTETRGAGDAAELSYSYNPMGWLVQSSGPSGTFDYGYDTAGNITLKDGVEYAYKSGTNQLISGSNSLAADYDGNGNVIGLEWPNIAWQYTYDSDANLTRVDKNGTAVEQAGYDFAGRRVSRVDEDGNRSIYVSGDYDVYSGNGQELHTKYVNGPDGRIAAITTEATPAQALQFRYRAALRAAHLFDGSTIKGTWLGTMHRLQALGYAAQSRPQIAVFPLLACLLGMLWVLLRRQVRRHGPMRSRLVWLLIFALIADPALRPLAAELAPGSGYPEPGILYFQGDLTQNNVLVTDSSGQPSSVVAYLPYGEIDQERSDGPNDFRPKFSGKEYDFGSELYFFGARYFHPELGRFLQPDPQAQYSSPYVYVGNDPLSLIDPDGEVAVAVVVGAMAAAGAVAGAYAGGSAVNQAMNPAHWDWSSGDTFAGIFAGAAIGAAGGAASGGLAAEAGVAAGIAGEVAIGAGEGAAFAILGGGSGKEIVTGAVTGGAAGGVAAGAGAGASRLASGSRFSRRGGASLAEGGAAGRAARRVGAAADLGGDGMGVESRALRQAQSGAVSRRGLNSSDFGTCAGFSFTSDTEVATPGGPVDIADVRPGDVVHGMRADGSAGSFTVLAAYKRLADQSVRVATGSSAIETTAEHPFWVQDRGWTAASDLRAGDRLLSLAGDSVTITGVSVADHPAWVYNFEVAESRNYFAGDQQVLVHNPARPSKNCFTGKATVRSKSGRPDTRLTAMGSTPGKNSRTGRLVYKRMKKANLIRTVNGQEQVKVRVRRGGARVWRDLDSNIHMGHRKDAVVYWNKEGYRFGARSREVRNFMLDASNYEFEWGLLNSGNGGRLGRTQRYRRPGGWPRRMGWPP